MSMTELKPCPFCGCDASLMVIEPHAHYIATFMPDYPGGAFIECTVCTASISGETEEEATTTWNRRTPERSAP